jgi:SOUL heme-binding protein
MFSGSAGVRLFSTAGAAWKALIAAGGAIGLGTTAVVGQSSVATSPGEVAPQASVGHGKAPEAPIDIPAVGTARRIGGDLRAAATEPSPGVFRFDRCLIDTPLPEGYPPPTPPGAIDLKSYPSVRRAEYRGTTAPDLGSNIGFFPLFNHIKRRDIAMTSPVEMDYRGINWQPADGGDVKPESWTMSFLYRKAEQGPAGDDPKDRRVVVVDMLPVTVVSLGARGGYGFQVARRRMEELSKWLDANPQFERAGDPRAFHYNGPDRRNADKWSEVQWPVRLRGSAAPVAPKSDAGAPAKDDAGVKTTPDSTRDIPAAPSQSP